jgi:hypothetical protein
VFINLKTDPRILHSSPCHAWRSDFCSHPRLDATWTPAHDPTRSSVSIRTTNSRNSTRMSARASARTSVSQFVLQVRAHAFGPCSDLRPPPHYDLNPCHPTPLDIRSGICLGIRSDIRVSIHLTSPSPCLRTPFRPLSSSVLQSEPLPSNSAWMSAWASARTSMSHSVLRVRARAFGARSDLRPCPRYECHADPNHL